MNKNNKTILMVAMLFLLIALVSSVTIDWPSNAFNITFVGGDNHSFFLSIPRYASLYNYSLNLSIFNNTFFLNYTGITTATARLDPLNIGPIYGAALDTTDNTFWIADGAGDDMIWHFTKNGSNLTGAINISAISSNPQGITYDVDNDSLWIVDNNQDQVLHVGTDGTIYDDNFSVTSSSSNPRYVDYYNGTLFIGDVSADRAYAFLTNSTDLGFNFHCSLGSLQGIAYLPANNTMLCMQTAASVNNIYHIDQGGAVLPYTQFNVSGGFTIRGLELDSDNTIYVGNDSNTSIANISLTSTANINISVSNLSTYNQSIVQGTDLSLSFNTTPINDLVDSCACTDCVIEDTFCKVPFTFFSLEPFAMGVNISNSTIFTNLTINIFNVETSGLITQNVDITIRDQGNFSTSTGVLNIDNFTLDVGPHLITATSTGFVTNQKEFTLTDKASTIVNLFMINSTGDNTGNLIVNIFDEFFNFMVGANVKLLEYDAGSNSFVEVSQCFSNTNGECIFGVELNTKFYIVQATIIRDGQVLFAQSTDNGEIIKLDNTIIELHMKTSDEFQVEDLFNLVVNPTNTTLVGNTSFLTAHFFDHTNRIHTVCISYSLERGLNDLELNSSCATGSAGIVNFAGGFLLNRNFTYLAQIYAIDNQSIRTVYNRYTYPALSGSLLGAFGAYLKPILLAIILALLAFSLYLKNMNIFAVGTMVLSLITPFYYPNIVGGVTLTFIVILDSCILYLSHKKQSLG